MARTRNSPSAGKSAKSQPVEPGKHSPVYGVFGDDFLSRDRFVSALREAFAATDPSGFNQERFDAQETPADAVLACAQSLPMFTAWRYVEVRNADLLNASQLEPYVAYLEHPNPTTCLVFVGESIDKKKKFFKKLDELGFLHEFARGNRTQALARIRDELQQFGLRFEEEVPPLLTELLGSQDMGLTLEKIRLYKTGRENVPLTAQEVLQLVGDGSESAIFSFIDDIFAGDAQRVFEQLPRLKEDRSQSPIAVIALLGRQLRSLVYLKSGVNPPGIPPFLLGKLGSLARSMKWKRLYDMYGDLVEADRRCKSSRADPWLVFEAMLLSWFTRAS